MRLPILLFPVILLACSEIVTADEAKGDAEAGAVKAETCAACHNSRVSLQGRGEDTIVQQSKAIIEGKKKHPPGLAKLSDADLADIAAYLDAAD